MAGGGTPTALGIFIVLLVLFALLGIFVPIFNMAFTNTETNDSVISGIVNGNSGLSILINTLISAGWTFGLPAWFNFILFLPRCLMWITGYYIIQIGKS